MEKKPRGTKAPLGRSGSLPSWSRSDSVATADTTGSIMSLTVRNRPTATDTLEDLLRELRRTRSESTRRKVLAEVVTRAMPLADGLAHRYLGRGIEREDLEQVARTALLAAVDRYHPGRGPGFVAFAVPTITGELKRHFRDSGWVVRPPRRVQERRAEVARAEDALRQRLGREPTVCEVAEALGCSAGEVREARLCTTGFRPLSLEAPVAGGGTAGERIADEDDPFDALELRSDLQALVSELPDRDKVIVRLRFVEGFTQGEIGEVIGVSQMQVSRLLARILDRLRSGMTVATGCPEPARVAAGRR